MSRIVNKLLSTTGSVVETDEFFNQTTLLLHGDGTNGAQNNTFLDSSSNNFTITRNGNTTQGSYSPYGDRWSNYFDGTGDYLAAQPTGTISIGSTTDFCIEAWIYPTDLSSVSQGILQAGELTGSLALRTNTDGTLSVIASGAANPLNGTVSLSDNQWYHVAATRSSNTLRLFINGVEDSSASDSTNYADPSPSSDIVVGARSFSGTPGNFFLGYISDLRFAVGNAIYTSNFTPPTEPLTAVSGTSLLTCQSNRFKDNSSNDFAITVNGDTKVTPFSPYAPSAAYTQAEVGGSGYFDGTGDYLSAPSSTEFDFGTGDFTIEGWVYTDSSLHQTLIERRTPNAFASGNWILFLNEGSISGNVTFYARDISSSAILSANSVLTIGAWNHVAVVRSGSNFTLYVNGISVSTYVSSNSIASVSLPIKIGEDDVSGGRFSLNGYTSDLRIVKGTALYTSNFTPPTAPLTAVTNTSLLCNFTNAGIFDSTGKNVLETVGNAQIDTAVTKFGTGSMEFDGSGDILLIPAPAIELAGDFTIEAWVNRVGVNSTTFDGIFTINAFDEWDEYPANTNIPGLVVSAGALHYGIGQATNYSSAIAVDGLWHHIACVRQGSTITVYIDGSSVLSVSNSDTYSNVNTPSAIGVFDKYNGSYRYFWNGYIDDFRITKGVARYTANFTPPTKAFPDQ